MPTPLLLTCVAALGALFGYANPWVHVPVAALLLPLSVIWLGLEAPTYRSAFKQAWQAGSLASLACLYWVYWPVTHYGEMHWALALPVPVLLAMGMGCYYGLFGLAARLSNRLAPPLAALFLGLAWTVMELAQASLLSGFSWLTLASAFVPWPVVVQTASFVGAYGLSGLLALVAAGLVLSRRSKSCAVLSLAAAVLVLGLGWQRLSSYAETTPAHVVAIVQGNIDQSIKWDPGYQLGTVDKYVALSRKVAATDNPELIVWPETSMPFYFQDTTPLRAPVLELAQTGKAALLLGSPAYDREGGPSGYTLYNRAFLLTQNAARPSWYDKEHLVPFGEYMPLAGILPLQKLVSGVGDFAPGRNTQALKSGDLALGVLVCYEAIFADLAQNRVAQGANLLINISNDAWFGDTSAPHQHLQLTALRAIEQGRYIVRSTNTGLSAFIDPLGRIRLAGPQFQELAASGLVHPRTELTVYHRFSAGLLIGLVALAVLFAILIIRGKGDFARNRNRL